MKKRCPGCLVEKARVMYSKCRARKDGLQVYCKVCAADRVMISQYKRFHRQPA